MAVVMENNYDPLSMSYLPSPLPFTGGNLHSLDYMSVPSVMDLQDQYSNFDSEPYMSGDDMAFATSSGLQHPAMMKRYSSGFEDPFAESTMAQYDQIPNESAADSPSIDRDSKYLSFHLPHYNFTLLDDSFRRTSVSISAQLHGMFFLAESQFPATPDTPPPPPELTCYRRNLFQITGSVTLPRNLRYVFTDEGQRYPIYELELAVSATESVENNPVKIISVPWKTPATGEASKPEDKLEREPPTIALDKMTGQDLDTDFTTFPIQWKRLQFRIATANNGRRKELQQHFTLHLKIMASLSTGNKISIAEARSGAVIVRGRSPRNFASRKDLPLSSSSTSRKHLPSASRASASQSAAAQVTSAPVVKTPPSEIPQAPAINMEDGDTTGPWLLQLQGESLPTPSFSTSMNPPAMPSFAHEPSLTPEINTPGGAAPAFQFTFPEMATSGTGPVSLHFGSDDEGSPYPLTQQDSRTSNSSRQPTSNPSPSLLNKGVHPLPSPSRTTSLTSVPTSQPHSRPRLHSHPVSMKAVTNPSISPAHLGHGRSEAGLQSAQPFKVEDDSDQLYEYFPLGLDDWMPPVDAVFRPHVVHHSSPLPPDPRSPGGRHTSKRYFSEVV